MHQAKRERLGGRGTAGKQPVFGMVERKGKVITKVVPDVSRETLLPNIREKVLPSSLVYSDEHASYDPLKSMLQVGSCPPTGPGESRVAGPGLEGRCRTLRRTIHHRP